mmetsp:Transcript_31743/g.42996  ORF Transcript_31743/g.42996 Transcript_31743/m.42996 type:complete len:148 (+) Transcript_31743:680-1123(+)
MEDMAGIRACHGEDPKISWGAFVVTWLGVWALTLVILGLKLAEIYQRRATVFANMGIGDFDVVHVSRKQSAKRKDRHQVTAVSLKAGGPAAAPWRNNHHAVKLLQVAFFPYWRTTGASCSAKKLDRVCHGRRTAFLFAQTLIHSRKI